MEESHWFISQEARDAPLPPADLGPPWGGGLPWLFFHNPFLELLLSVRALGSKPIV